MGGGNVLTGEIKQPQLQEKDMSDYDEDYDEDEDEDEEEQEPLTDLPTLTIDVSPRVLDRHIASQIAKALPRSKLRDMVNERIDVVLDKKLDEILLEIVGKTAAESVEKYLTTRRKKTNEWGESTGPEIPLSDHVIDVARKMISGSDRDYGDKRAEAMVKKLLFEPLEARLKEMLEEVRREKEGQADALIARMLRESMKKAKQIPE